METTEQKIDRIIQETDRNFAPYYGEIPRLINERGYKTAIEVGTFCGGHALSILRNSNIELLVGIDKYEMYEQSHLLNIASQEEWDYLYDTVMNRINTARVLKSYKNIISYHHIREHSDTAFKLFPEMKFDIIFLDGNHTYEQLKRDLDNSDKIIRKGGIVAGHDANHPTFPDLTIAILEYAKDHNAEVYYGELHTWWIDKTW